MLSVTLTILRILVFLLIIKKLDKYLLNLSEIHVSGKSLKVSWTLKVTNNTIYMFKSTYFTSVHLWALENSTFNSCASYPLHPPTHPLLWGYEKKGQGPELLLQTSGVQRGPPLPGKSPASLDASLLRVHGAQCKLYIFVHVADTPTTATGRPRDHHTITGPSLP